MWPYDPGVSMLPGQTAFTRTFSGAKSIAQHLVSCSTPPGGARECGCLGGPVYSGS